MKALAEYTGRFIDYNELPAAENPLTRALVDPEELTYLVALTILTGPRSLAMKPSSAHVRESTISAVSWYRTGFDLQPSAEKTAFFMRLPACCHHLSELFEEYRFHTGDDRLITRTGSPEHQFVMGRLRENLQTRLAIILYRLETMALDYDPQRATAFARTLRLRQLPGRRWSEARLETKIRRRLARLDARWADDARLHRAQAHRRGYSFNQQCRHCQRAGG
jgi:hypothetical protein